MSNISLLSACNITTGKLDSNAAVDNGKYYYFTCAPEPLRIDNYAFDCDAILLAGNNASGNFHCQRYKGKFNAYQRTYIITAKDGYNLDYIYYNLLINLELLKKHSQGSQTKFLTMEMLNSFMIKDIKYIEQCDLVESLVTIDSKIRLNNSICKDLEAMAKQIYDYWFVQFDFPDENGNPYKSSGGKMVWCEELNRGIPEGWEVTNLKGRYQLERGISYTSKDIQSGEGIAMLNLACIDRNRNYRDGELKYYNGRITDEDMVKPFDLMIACTDLTREREIIGCPVLVPDDGVDYTYTMDIAKIHFIDDNIEDLYMYAALRTDFYHDYIKQWASGTNVLHLNLEGLDWYTTYIPDIVLQKKYAELIKKIHTEKSKKLLENQQLTELRDFLLPMLMNGQISIK